MRQAVCAALVLGVAIALSACERGVHDMYDQPRYTPLEPSPLFDNGNSSQAPPAGTVPAAAGAVAGTSSGRRGQIEAGTIVVAATPVPVAADGRPLVAHATYDSPLPPSMALLQRGRQRYNIYCAPCHGRGGDGDGMVVRHGFPAPPSFHQPRLRAAADSHFYEVITHGYGVMYPYAGRVEPHDRWAIVAYLRALQLSRHAPAAQLSPQDLRKLGGVPDERRTRP